VVLEREDCCERGMGLGWLDWDGSRGAADPLDGSYSGRTIAPWDFPVCDGNHKVFGAQAGHVACDYALACSSSRAIVRIWISSVPA
jgi:hypothetical protein